MAHFQANVKHTEQDEQGRMKVLNESYLFEAEDYTAAELATNNFYSEMQRDYKIDAIKKMKLQEIFFVENGHEDWYKAKVQYITFDEKTQKEKKTPYNILINAENPKDAYELLKTRLGPINDYVITDINLTPILEVIPAIN